MAEEIKKTEVAKPGPKPKEEKKDLKGEFTAITSDHKEMKGDFDILKTSGLITHYYQKIATTTADKISLIKVNSVNFDRISQFYTFYSKGKKVPIVEKPLKTNKLPELIKDEWTLKFIDQPTKDLCELLAAATYMKLEDLKQLVACVIASRLYGKKPEELRKEYSIESELTADQEKTLNRFFGWADQFWP